MLERILIIGADSQIGKEIEYLSRTWTYAQLYDIVFTDKDELDITNISEVQEKINDKYSIVINCAAYTDVDKAEKEQDACHSVNVKGVRNIADRCKDLNILLIHISSDYVYDGNKCGPYFEHELHPWMTNRTVNYYGFTKFLAEKEIYHSGCNHIIFRTQWLYSKFNKNFFLTIQNLLRDRKDITVIDDIFGTPTYARSLARTIFKLLFSLEGEFEIRETFNFSNEGVASWYDFAHAIGELTGLMDSEVKPIEYWIYKQVNPNMSKKPLSTILSKSKLKSHMGDHYVNHHWREYLKECIMSK